MAIFYGVGVGSGDPELLTLKAVRIIRECEVIAVATKQVQNSVAYQIVEQVVPEISNKELLGISMPMTKQEEELKEAHKKGADLIAAKLAEGKNIAFLTLGDPTIFSTYTYLQEIVKKQGLETRIVNGIASFLSAASLLNTKLIEREEMFHIIPSTYGFSEAIHLKGTKVFMKAGGVLEELKKELEESGQKVFFIENCGMERERVLEGVYNIPDEAGYYSMVVAFEKEF